MKTEYKDTLISRLKELRDNAIFESKEDEDSIEHVDVGATELKSLLTETIVYLRTR